MAVDDHHLDGLLARIDAALRAIDPADMADVAAEPMTVELTVESRTGVESWFVRLDGNGGRAARGPADDPSVVIRIDERTLADLRSGALDVPHAIDAGRLAVRGDLGGLARARPALRALAVALGERSRE